MSYTFAYYLAYFIDAFGRLAGWVCLGIFPAAAYLWWIGNQLEHNQTNEPVRNLIDWTSGGNQKKYAYLLLVIALPFFYIVNHMIPDPRTIVDQLGFKQNTACMKVGEKGELVAGQSGDDLILYASFKMMDGTTIMCKIENMRAVGAKLGSLYSVTQGHRVS